MRNKKVKRVKNIRILKLATWSLIFLAFIYLFSASRQIAQQYKFTPFWLWNFILGHTYKVKQFDKSVNIVIFGIGGANHEGADLTDTILVVNLNLVNGNLVFISIPRDIWISSIKDKINAAYHFGEIVQKGKGLLTAKAAVEEVVGLPIHYGVVIDFSGFVKIVDLVGGIDVDIEQGFTDEFYPITGKENADCGGDLQFKCRYESVTFSQGIEHMDGQRALKYVRSRHAAGEAGTDISRGHRQQAVLIALKNKLLNLNLFANPTLIKKLIQTSQDSIVTDLPLGEGLLYGRIYLKNQTPPLQIGLNYDQPEYKINGLLKNPPPKLYDGKWVLVPQSGSFNEIHKYINCSVHEFRDCKELIK